MDWVPIPTFPSASILTCSPFVALPKEIDLVEYASNAITPELLYILPTLVEVVPITKEDGVNTSLSNLNCWLPWFHCRDADAPSIVIPAPFAAEELAAPDANVRFKSSTVSVVELIVVVVPSTCKSPAITTVPVLSP